ncbi:MAG: hypothetical protein VKJ24_12215 [Synechococcales bacterium]|nr:hypothetical protein [Synechococcales bacterium]
MRLLISPLGRWLGYPLGILAVVLIAGKSAPSAADTAITVENTASGNFRSTPTGPFVNRIPSNPTQAPAIVVVPNRPALEIIKSGDRSAAEPGDTITYRLLIRNTGTEIARDITITDTLPIGLQFIANSVRAGITIGGTTNPIVISAPTVNGRTITFRYPGELNPRQETLSLVYAAIITQDAIRGDGRNLASSEGRDPFGRFISNTASHKLNIRSGILSDCGTIIGRVFVDKNFDGEQQLGEPGVPNAVIFMDDGNRITTDANGLYSLAYVIAGQRVGTLDLVSLPGYTLAPNLYRIEKNSPSRMVSLPPGGMARMNFAVTPTFGEGRP